jgi:hypothetical protein
MKKMPGLEAFVVEIIIAFVVATVAVELVASIAFKLSTVAFELGKRPIAEHIATLIRHIAGSTIVHKLAAAIEVAIMGRPIIVVAKHMLKFIVEDIIHSTVGTTASNADIADSNFDSTAIAIAACNSEDNCCIVASKLDSAGTMPFSLLSFPPSFHLLPSCKMVSHQVCTLEYRPSCPLFYLLFSPLSFLLSFLLFSLPFSPPSSLP